MSVESRRLCLLNALIVAASSALNIGFLRIIAAQSSG